MLIPFLGWFWYWITLSINTMSELKTILSGRISGYEAKMLGASGREEELFRLLFDADKRTSDNAAWALTHLPPSADSWLAERQEALIDEVLRTNSTSKRRLILSLLARTPFERDRLRTDFLDFCFNTILSTEPVGVRTLAVKLSYAQSRHYPELLEEFKSILQMMVPEEQSAAMRLLLKKVTGGD